MIFKRPCNAYGFSYFPPVILVALIAIVMAATFGGCKNNQETGLGSIAGVAHLSAPDPGTGDAGILIYLAGTPYQARSDQQGRYLIDGIPAGTYDLIAEKEGFAAQIIENLLMLPQQHTSATPLQPAETLLIKNAATTAPQSGTTLGMIKGNVLLEGMPDENGGVRVEVDGTPFVTVSSNDGQFRIMNVEPGQYRLSFYHDGYLPYKTQDTVDVTTGVITLNDVALQLVQPGDPVSAASVAAAVAASAATPLQIDEPPPEPGDPRSIVGLVEVRDTAGQVLSDYTDVTVAINGTSLVAAINEQGQFRFDNLTSGTYTVIGSVPDAPLVQIPVDLATQRTASVTVKLEKGAGGGEAGGAIRGRVVLLNMDDEPLPDSAGVSVAVNGTQAVATTAADGTFELTGIPPGTYTISATKEGFKPGAADGVAVNAVAAVDVGEIRMMMNVDRPRVISTIPSDNAKDVTVGFDLPITIKFSDRMNGASVRGAISISPSTPFTAIIGKGAGVGADDDTLIIKLSNDSAEAPIQFGALYRITIAQTAANLDGVTMAEPFKFSFRTAKPGVIQVSPENGSNDAYLDQLNNTVLFTFNTRLDPNSINDRNIRVRPDGGVSVSTTFTNAEATGWTTVRVSTRWQPDTAYTVTVGRRVKALNGQPLGNTPYTLKFRTAPMEIMTMPIQTVR